MKVWTVTQENMRHQWCGTSVFASLDKAKSFVLDQIEANHGADTDDEAADQYIEERREIDSKEGAFIAKLDDYFYYVNELDVQ